MREIRIQKNISQKELSERTGLSLRCIQYYETLTTIPSIKNAYRISRCLESSIEQIFPYDELK